MGAPGGPTLMRPAGPVDGTGLGAYLEHLSSTRDLRFEDHRTLWRCSVGDPEAFWARSGTSSRCHAPTSGRPARRQMPGAGGSRAAAELRRAHAAAPTATPTARHHRPLADARAGELTFGELRDQVARARAGCSGSGWGAATASSRTCRTCPRRSWRSWRPRAWARCGHRARRSSAPAASSTAWPRSSPRCCSPSRLPLRRQGDRPARRGGRDPRGAADAPARRRRSLRAAPACPTR